MASTATNGTAESSKTLRPSELEVEKTSKQPPNNGPMSPLSWRDGAPAQQQRFRRQKSATLDAEDYFVGPRDMNKHSKWPFFLRMHGSVLPKMILPITVVGAWATLITLICEKKKPLVVSNLLLTVLGFVVGLAISFRTSSAYERYAEGRKYWSQLLFVGQNLARTIWVHAAEREGQEGKEDLLAKLTALNLIVAYATALKHKLRFEPGIDYPDLRPLVEYLDTFAKAAEVDIPPPKEPGKIKAMGEYLGVTFAESNPRKRIKRSKKPLGNLPLEIVNHLSAYIESIIANETLKVPAIQNQAVTGVVALNEVMIGVERILQTPLPIAYSIAISQITWVYVMMLPFQLWDDLRWVTIPGTIFAAYIILGMAAIGREIENPFGNDVNDLPLEAYCEELAADIDTITSTPAPSTKLFMRHPQNQVMWPLSGRGWDSWKKVEKQEIREALLTKTKADMTIRRSINPERSSSFEEKHQTGAQGQEHSHA